MSLPPITLSDLDPAGTIDPANDLLLIRQSMNDRKITAQQLQSFRLTGIPSLPGAIVASDVLLIGRNNGSGYDNYLVSPQFLGFLTGVKCWFYQATAPLGWTIVGGTGDRVLGTIGAAGAIYNGTGLRGSWQQKDHTLTIAQMPAHKHKISASNNNEDNWSDTTRYAQNGKINPAHPTLDTELTGGGQGHNHGNVWRPAGAIGIICQKTS